jgi:hypothetical protein
MAWKISKIKPITKKNKSVELSDYRPISLAALLSSGISRVFGRTTVLGLHRWKLRMTYWWLNVCLFSWSWIFLQLRSWFTVQWVLLNFIWVERCNAYGYFLVFRSIAAGVVQNLVLEPLLIQILLKILENIYDFLNTTKECLDYWRFLKLFEV